MMSERPAAPVRCLFTRKPILVPSLEHAPQKRMGGRLTCSWSVEGEFNNLAGARIDLPLIHCWQFVLSELAPLLPAQAALNRKIPVSDQQGRRFDLAPGMVLQDRKPDVEIDPVSGHVVRVRVRTPEEALKWRARRPELAEARVVADVPVVEGPLKFTDGVVNDLGSDVGALKALIGVFDIHHRCSPSSWVRSPHLAEARDVVRVTATGGPPNPDALLRVIKGIDYSVQPSLRALFEKHFPGFSLFHHGFVASGDRATRRITAHWLIFGWEPFGCLLSTTYDGPGFTELVAMDPLKMGKTRFATSDLRWGKVNLGLATTFMRKGPTQSVFLDHVLADRTRVEDEQRRRSLETHIAVQQRAHLEGEAHYLQVARCPDQAARKCSLHVLFCRRLNLPVPETVGQLVAEMATRLWPKTAVATSSSDLPPSDCAIKVSAPEEWAPWSPEVQASLGDWVDVAGTMYLDLVERLYRSAGTPRPSHSFEVFQSTVLATPR